MTYSLFLTLLFHNRHSKTLTRIKENETLERIAATRRVEEEKKEMGSGVICLLHKACLLIGQQQEAQRKAFGCFIVARALHVYSST